MRKKRGFIDIQNMKPRFTFIFPCPRKNSCVGREKKKNGREGKLQEYFGGNGSVIEKGCVI